MIGGREAKRKFASGGWGEGLRWRGLGAVSGTGVILKGQR